MTDENSFFTELVKLVALPSVLCTVIVSWFFLFQERPYELNREQGTIIGEIANSLVRTISHLTNQHLISNVLSFFTVGFISILFSGARFYLVNLVSVLFANVLLLAFVFETAVGSSLLVFGIYSVSLSLFIKFQYQAYRIQGIATSNRQFIVISLMLAVSLFSYIPSIVIDALVTVGVISIENPSVFGFLLENTENYTQTSSKGHILGLVVGFVSFTFWNAIFRIRGYRVTEI